MDFAGVRRRAMLASARVAHLARRGLDFGVRTGSVSVDLRHVGLRARSVMERLGGPGEPPPEPLAASVLDEDSVLDLDTVPEHLLVLGGTPAGVELAQIFRRFGSRVSLVEPAPQLLPREDRDVAAALAEVLRQEGVAVFLESSPVRRTPGAGVTLRLRSPAGERVLMGSHLLVADYGRVRTKAPADGHTACCNVFTDPPLARLGLTEAQARRAGHAVRVAKMPLTRVARAVEADETRGFAKMIVDAATRRILGAAVLAMDGGEVMAMLHTAMIAGLPWPALRDGLAPHPTMAQTLGGLLAALELSEENAQ